MNRVACLPWPGKENCFLHVSAAQRQIERVGDKWYTNVHQENVKRYVDGPKTEPTITFSYVKDGVAAEWDGSYGPITIWFKGEEDDTPTDNYYNQEPRPHWIWPLAYGWGNWSQLAVEEAELPGKFILGDFDGIFAVLRQWVANNTPGPEATGGGDAD